VDDYQQDLDHKLGVKDEIEERLQEMENGSKEEKIEEIQEDHSEMKLKEVCFLIRI